MSLKLKHQHRRETQQRRHFERQAEINALRKRNGLPPIRRNSPRNSQPDVPKDLAQSMRVVIERTDIPNEYLYLYRKADDDMTTKRYVWLTTSNSGGIQYKQGFDTLWEAITTMYDLGWQDTSW